MGIKHRALNLHMKRQAYKEYKSALRSGALKRPTLCELCGEKNRSVYGPAVGLFGHHEDYAKPLEVLWVCSHCHGLLHRGFTREEITAHGRGWSGGDDSVLEWAGKNGFAASIREFAELFESVEFEVLPAVRPENLPADVAEFFRYLESLDINV